MGGPYNPNFVVDGLALGGAVNPDSAVYKSCTCRPSDDFTGFTWCAFHHAATSKSSPYTSWVTILHSSANKIAFVTQAIVPAFFQPGDVDREIQRLSRDFGQSARIFKADPRPGVPHAILAAWGAVTLNPLDEAAVDALRRGEQIHRGLLADFTGDAHNSARLGLPVYSIGGGPGYLWGANFDDAGRGSLRMSALDVGALGATRSVPTVAVPPNASPTPLSVIPLDTNQPRTDSSVVRTPLQAAGSSAPTLILALVRHWRATIRSSSEASREFTNIAARSISTAISPSLISATRTA